MHSILHYDTGLGVKDSVGDEGPETNATILGATRARLTADSQERGRAGQVLRG